MDEAPENRGARSPSRELSALDPRYHARGTRGEEPSPSGTGRLNGPPPRAGIVAARGGGDPGVPNGAPSIELVARAGGEPIGRRERRSRGETIEARAVARRFGCGCGCRRWFRGRRGREGEGMD